MTKRSIVEEIHRPARKKFPRRSTILRGISDLYQADLVEMIPYEKENDGYKYILTCINCFSKVAYCAPLFSKSTSEVARQMELYVLSKLSKKEIPKLMQTDAGTEFMGKPFQKLMKDHHVHHYTTYSTIKAAIVERFNRTLKTKMWIEFHVQGSYRWVDLLPKLVKVYNETKHRSIGVRPIDVNSSNENSIMLRLNRPKYVLDSKPKFEIGQYVRVSKQKHVFSKGYHPNWSYEVFKISKASATRPRVYHLLDLKGNIIKGCFYEQELQATKHQDQYLVEKVLKRRGDNVLVKWFGFDSTENSWIPMKSLD